MLKNILFCCCLITVPPVHKILQALGFPTTKLSMSTGKELVTSNLFHNYEIAFLFLSTALHFCILWEQVVSSPSLKKPKKFLLNFFFNFRREGWRFGEVYCFFSFGVEGQFQIHTIKTPKFSACIFPCITPESRLVQLVSETFINETG